MRESINTSRCTDCETDLDIDRRDRFNPTSAHEVETDSYEGVVLNFPMRCPDCGEEGNIQYTEEGVRSSGFIDLSEASYNESQETEDGEM